MVSFRALCFPTPIPAGGYYKKKKKDVDCATQLAKLRFNHSIGLTGAAAFFSNFYKIKKPGCRKLKRRENANEN